MTSFPRATGMTRGYSRPQVDRFLARVQAALEGGPGASDVTAAGIRRAGFDLVRGGYDVTAVDAHLDVLELRALALEKRAGVPGARTGAEDRPDHLPEQLLDVLDAPPGRRVPRTTGLHRGYARREVDAFLDALAASLDGQPVDGTPLDAEAVRRAVFHVRLRGYDEGAVDDALDLAVDVLLRRSHAAPVPPSVHRPVAGHDADAEHTLRVEAGAVEAGAVEAGAVGADDTVVLDRRIDRVS